MDLALLLTSFMLLPADSSSKQTPVVEAARGPQHQLTENEPSERATAQSNPSSIVETSSDTVQQRLLATTQSVPHPPSQPAHPAEADHSTRTSGKGTADSSAGTEVWPGTESVSVGATGGGIGTGALPGLAAQESVRETWPPKPGNQHTSSAAEHRQAPADEPALPAEALPAEGPARSGKKASKHKHRNCKQQ